MSFKFRKLIGPVAAASALLALIYSAFDWFFVAGTGWLPLDKSLADLVLPVVLAAALAMVFVRRHIRALALREEWNLPLVYLLVAGLTVAAPTIAAQYYVDAVAGGVTHVTDVSRIARAAHTRFYTIDKVCVLRAQAGGSPSITPPSVFGHDADVALYVAAPACDGGGWIGYRYRTTINPDLGDAFVDAAYNKFAADAEKRFNAEDPAKYTYVERVGAGFDRRNFEKAVATSPMHETSPTVFLPHEGDVAVRGRSLPPLIAVAFVGLNLLWLAMVLLTPLSKERPVEMPRDPEEPRPFRYVFVPSRASYGLPLLIDTNVLVFLAMVLSGLGIASFQTDDLIAWGANSAQQLHGVGWLRLITSQFVHAGFAHIASNMYALVFMGLFLAPVMRNWGLIASYLVCGLGGAIASAVVHPDVISVGASGAIMGLAGILLALFLLGDWRLMHAPRAIVMNVILAVGLTLGQGFVIAEVDNAAHIGGLVTGFVLGLVLHYTGRNRRPAFPQTG
ncbi:MAG TPA: rhomboid family intramembrane serine protease [Rhizomicrobium sp.]